LKIKKTLTGLLVVLSIGISGYYGLTSDKISGFYKVTSNDVVQKDNEEAEPKSDISVSMEDIPEYSGEAYVIINENQPDFSEEDKQSTEAFEYYSELDSLGRCGQAYANVCPELQPTKERGEIGQIKPSGWHTVKYNDLIEGNYLYNRCHLIGYQLTGENANEKNLITGTRYLNVTGMLPFENEVDDYVDATGNHVLYRVTPVFEGNNLVASGVQIEAWSVEDGGQGVCFNVYCYNVQPGIEIDYATGDSRIIEDTAN
jgi:DNA-entry nuclease